MRLVNQDHQPLATDPQDRRPEVPASLAAEASSAHSRLNLPLNLDCWKHLPEEVSGALLWFHQHALDQGLSWDQAVQALGLQKEGRSVLFAALKGTYGGSYAEIAGAIEEYKRIAADRAGILRGEWVETPITRLICAALDYALANNSITLIEGESGHGKTTTGQHWQAEHNHGRTVMVEAPPLGGPRDFLRVIANAVGVNKNLAMGQLLEAVLRAFNRERMLMVDEAHRLTPIDSRSNPAKVDLLRYIHDRTGCALALFATRRFGADMARSTYQFEQILGRIGMPVRLPKVLEPDHYRPLVVQYFPRPSDKLLTLCGQLANDAMPRQKGRLRLLSQALRLSTRIASKAKTRLTEEHFFKALALREQMMGDQFER